MWCPNCKSEYRPGITTCPACNLPLTAEEAVSLDVSSAKNRVHLYDQATGDETLHSLSGGLKTYVEKSVKYEDMKSTAYSFLFVGCAGMILLILALTGVLPLQFADYMKYMMSIVMGGLFLVFLIVGFLSFRKLSTLKTEIAAEQQNYSAAHGWFFDHYTAETLDEACMASGTNDLQQRYYYRTAYMKKMLMEQFEDFEESFTDYLIEQFYEELYPEES